MRNPIPLVIVACVLGVPGSSAQTVSDPAVRLFQARSIRCEWGPGTQGKWEDGQPSLELGTFGPGATVTYDSINGQTGEARVVGNTGAFDVSVLQTPVGLTFIEVGTGLAGGLSFTTVFASTVDRDTATTAERAQRPLARSSYIGVISRHLDIAGTILPSQWHGTCRILQ